MGITTHNGLGNSSPKSFDGRTIPNSKRKDYSGASNTISDDPVETLSDSEDIQVQF